MNTKKILRLIAVLSLLGVFLFSGWKVISTLSEYRQSEESYEALAQEYIISKVEIPVGEPMTLPQDTDSPMTLTPETDSPKIDEPLETAPITVDFDALLGECPDVVGWIYCPDTPIHYPIVQAGDNNYYLRRLLDGSYNISGSIFMDYRCASDFSDWNSIVYGHNMNNDAMFGTLQNYREQEYYDAHPVLYLLTPTQDYKIVVVGGYTVSSTDATTYAIPESQEKRDLLLEKALHHTELQTDVKVADNERFITLSTCAYEYDGARYVLIGVLRELVPFVEGESEE